MPEAVKTAKKTAPKAAAKAAAKKSPEKKAETNGATKIDRAADKSHTPIERCDIAVKALRKLGAINADSAVTVETLANKSGLKKYDAYVTVWTQSKLQLGGFVKQADKIEGVKGAAYYLTKLGQSTLLSEKAQK